MAAAPDDLCSWKEIAAYLGVSVKTAQIWERDRGLPVRRLPGDRRGQVRAVPSEIDEWKGATDRSEPLQPDDFTPPVLLRTLPYARWLLVPIVASLLLALAWPRPDLAALRVEPETVVGVDGNGEVLWRNPSRGLDPLRYGDGDQRTWVGKLGGATAALIVPVPAGLVQQPVPLVCFDAKGRERWRFVPGKTVRHGADVYAPPFVVRQFAVFGDKILVTSHHHLYYPSQVAVLDQDGRLLREYWHAGHLNVLTTVTYQGKPVALLGGVNNAQHQATLVVLDPDTLAGSAVEHDRPVFEDMPAAGQAIARILFPRSGISPADPYNVVVNLIPSPSGVIVDVRERLTGANPPSILYHLDHGFELSQVVVSDIFLSERRQHAFTAAEEAGLRQLTRVR